MGLFFCGELRGDKYVASVNPEFDMTLARRLKHSRVSAMRKSSVKAAKYEKQKPSTCRATFFRCKFSSMFPVFHLA